MMTNHAALPLAAGSALQWFTDNMDWTIAGVIVLVCLLLYGAKDVLRFSLVRSRAVASVCFRESIRRRVLWLTPLAIIGVVLVSQFQRPLDEQDAARQSVRFCVFASGMLVTVALTILACTNLPREIDNRVIYTVVTKPTSRLEILVGKIAGFAAVSALILVIMGAFSWAYLQTREWQLMRGVKQQLAEGGLEPAAEATLKHYAEQGILDARDYRTTPDVQARSRYQAPNDKVTWFEGSGEQEVLVPFVVNPNEISIGAGDAAMLLRVSLLWEQQRTLTDEERKYAAQIEAWQARSSALSVSPGGSAFPGIDLAGFVPAFVRVGFYTRDLQLISDQQAKPIPISDPSGREPTIVPIPEGLARTALSQGGFYVSLLGMSPGTRYAAGDDPVALLLPSGDPAKPLVIERYRSPLAGAVMSALPIRGRMSPNGQQLRGDTPEKAPLGVFGFRGAVLPLSGDRANLEIRTVVDKQDDAAPGAEKPTIIEVSVADRDTRQVSPPATVAVESRRSAHVSVPAEFLRDGNFDVLVRSITPKHWISLRPDTVRVAGGDRGFGMNLAKSYLVLWLMSILVITVAIFCSTFLSWPIAVVLTAVILLGHWGVLQLGELADPGVGRQVVNDLFSGAAPAVAETLTRSVEGLTSLTRTVAAFLPDISQFGVLEDVEQGVVITTSQMAGSIKTLLLFCAPILALSYVFFRNKEVAP